LPAGLTFDELTFDETPGVRFGFGDGLRALAILLIVLFHAHAEIVPQLRFHHANLFVPLLDDLGRLPVAMLFVLSGFLLSRPFLAAILDGGPLPHPGEFWLARFLRIYPLYACAVAAVAIVDAAFMHQRVTAADIASHLTLTHTFSPDTAETISEPFWTLAVDAQFYLLLPLLGAAASLSTRGRSVAGRIAFLIVASLGVLALDAVIRFALLLPVRSPVPIALEEVLTKNIWGTLGVFLLGALVQLWTMFAGRIPPQSRRSLARRAFVAAGVLLAAHVAAEVVHLHAAGGYVAMPDKLWGAFEDVVAGGGCALLLLGLAARPDGHAARLLATPAAVSFAALSYAVYLFHSTVLKALSPLLGALPVNAGFAALFVAGLSVVLPLAFVAHRVVERPFLRLKDRLRGQFAVSRPAVERAAGN
jgi:peptidoglycan/LPS O-acetylase OafA/YrhL